MKKLTKEQKNELLAALGTVVKYVDRCDLGPDPFVWTFSYKGMLREVEVSRPKTVTGWTMEDE